MAEAQRLEQDKTREQNWKRWGPYLSERQWGTVREDYSSNGDCWNYLTHDHARSKAYRWGEDGLLGYTDRECRLSFALALWNGKDPILKERLYGLTGPEGNHGEDVKEYYFYLDSTPTHSYMRGLYKYPQNEYPYEWLRTENSQRSRLQDEFELDDTGIFNNNEYFDVFVEYAKNTPDDTLILITIHNRSDKIAPLHVLPTVWNRNTWSWGSNQEGYWPKPEGSVNSQNRYLNKHKSLGNFLFAAEALENSKKTHPAVKSAEWIVTDNETNLKKLYNVENQSQHVKDGFHEYVINGRKTAVNSDRVGTKAAALHYVEVPAKSSVQIKLRLFSENSKNSEIFGSEFDRIFSERKKECKIFYDGIFPSTLTDDEKEISSQAYAGLLWSKQYYHYTIEYWLKGDPAQPTPPQERRDGRNNDWNHLFNRDVISMPDKWEYPWYAVWDLAFHCVAFSAIDIEFAKSQLGLMLREWYMHPNGALPAYEFNFGDGTFQLEINLKFTEI
eukprot:TRINITY_DN3251_c0_g1_i1.p1 TRINITY_DN3251_c0_g1~~TRINITY_DN3251_c0_g1_i1.p1  ORF type:complete len:526 (+),score=179.42 TRINITY_DN3251_c0_g1_i1:78-1580(+)